VVEVTFFQLNFPVAIEPHSATLSIFHTKKKKQVRFNLRNVESTEIYL
jgi:hypothetical protein